MIGARFADMPFIHCKQEVSYSRRLRDAINARVEIMETRCCDVAFSTSHIQAIT